MPLLSQYHLTRRPDNCAPWWFSTDFFAPPRALPTAEPCSILSTLHILSPSYCEVTTIIAERSIGSRTPWHFHSALETETRLLKLTTSAISEISIVAPQLFPMLLVMRLNNTIIDPTWQPNLQPPSPLPVAACRQNCDGNCRDLAYPYRPPATASIPW